MKNLIGVSGKIGSGKSTIGRIIQYLTSESINIMSYEEYQTSESKYRFSPIWEVKAFAGKLKQIVSILTGIPVEDLEKEEVKSRALGQEWYYEELMSCDANYLNLNVRKVFSTYKEGVDFIKNSGWLEEDFGIKNNQYTVRQLLQKVGTEAMRDVIHPNIWVNALFSEYNFTVDLRGAKAPENLGDGKFSYEITNDKIIFPNWIITDLRLPNEYDAIKERGGILIRVNREDNSDKKGFILKGRTTGNKLMVHQDNHPSETALDNHEFNYTINNSGSIEDLIKEVKVILLKEQIL